VRGVSTPSGDGRVRKLVLVATTEDEQRILHDLLLAVSIGGKVTVEAGGLKTSLNWPPK
jgi:hypothetical protein